MTASFIFFYAVLEFARLTLLVYDEAIHDEAIYQVVYG